jgi:hypothetical protein
MYSSFRSGGVWRAGRGHRRSGCPVLSFFNLPLAEKLAVRRPRPEQNRGYIAPGEERLARLRGDERRVGRKSKRTHLQDFVHGDGPLRSIGQQTTPIAVRVPLCSVPDEGLGREHVRRAYSPQLNLPRQGASIHRCPERDKSVPRTPDPAMAFPQLMRARSGQRKPAPFCKVRQASSVHSRTFR